ncbi:MAG: hypothetical protein ACRD59_10050 [Candidatus Acidiferrales bacterium]
MKKIILFTLLLLFFAAAGTAKADPKPIKLFLSPASTISSADLMKHIVEKCPNVAMTLDSKKSDFMLEAGGWSGNYKFTVYQHGGVAVYSTTTRMLSNAVKDVCKYVNVPK